VQSAHRAFATIRGAQVALAIGPECSKSGTQQNDDAIRKFSIFGLPCQEVRHGHPIVTIGPGLFRHIDQHGRADQVIERDFIGVLSALGEMYGCIEVRSAVFSGAKSVGFVVIAALCHAFEVTVHLEAGSRWPINGIAVICMSEIYQIAAGK
jgi:hypothetical protein